MIFNVVDTRVDGDFQRACFCDSAFGVLDRDKIIFFLKRRFLVVIPTGYYFNLTVGILRRNDHARRVEFFARYIDHFRRFRGYADSSELGFFLVAIAADGGKKHYEREKQR